MLTPIKLSAVRAHGLKRTFKQLLTLDQPKVGALVGVDVHGNEYYENRNDIVGRDRWVLFSKWNYDSTQVPPEWHQWLHKTTDDIPSDKTVPVPFYTPPHQEFYTGTRAAFKTYSTVKPKIEEWNGKPINRS
ncbi:NADH dehydrogenase 1 alpha subcomplex subunit 12 ndufa12/DAP13 [Phlyctochytrium planicorne]|nr:NADH dehydrogenase 1 alpha subcomplex subunit 12 ndufa12/DAP13 [Phlyctochytrium planicorne]